MLVILLLVVVVQPGTMDQQASTMDHFSGQDMDSNQLERIRDYLGSTARCLLVVDVLLVVVIVVFLEVAVVLVVFMDVWS